MARTDLPVTGKDTKITLTVNGALKKVADQVEDISPKAMYDEITHKPLGTSRTKIAKELTGWEGTITMREATKDLDEMIDLINLYRRTGVSFEVAITQTTIYRNGTSKTHTYPNVEFEFEKSVKRGEANRISLPWKTGEDRIGA